MTPRVCLNMIVKDEAAVIERCLRSVCDHVQSWAIVDTGSSDGTQGIVRDFLSGLPGELIERPWVDFSTNRNQALDLARRHGEFAFFIDADDTLETDAGFTLAKFSGPFYSIETTVQGITGWTPALVRLDADWAWEGVLHEVLKSRVPVPRSKLEGARLRKHEGGARSRIGKREKYARDAEVLRQALEREPGNQRYQFYYARSLLEAGQLPAALEAFRRRSHSGGWDEEVYVARLMVAVIAERLGAAPEQAVAAFLDAYRFRPSRAEALTRLAHLMNRLGRFQEACRYARAACATAVPSDTLMLDRAAYGWKPRDDLAVALHHLGEHAACIAVYREMLADPGLPATERARVERHLLESQTLLAEQR